jgi:hypothetical protein
MFFNAGKASCDFFWNVVCQLVFKHKFLLQAKWPDFTSLERNFYAHFAMQDFFGGPTIVAGKGVLTVGDAQQSFWTQTTPGEIAQQATNPVRSARNSGLQLGSGQNRNEVGIQQSMNAKRKIEA